MVFDNTDDAILFSPDADEFIALAILPPSQLKPRRALDTLPAIIIAERFRFISSIFRLDIILQGY